MGILTTQAVAAPMATASAGHASAAIPASGSSSAGTTGPATCLPGYAVNGSYAPPTTPPHIMEIMMENASYTAGDGSPFVIGNSQAPYINNTLIGADNYTSLTQWDSIEHNSPLDYMDAISGCDHNGVNRPYPDPTLVNELDTAGFTWKAYMDGLAAGQTCYTGHGSGTPGGYVQNHNPFIYFAQVINNTIECNANVVPYFGGDNSPFASDLNSKTPPDFVWITPSTCDDMHSRCAPLNNLVAQGDTWLANNLPTVLKSNWYTQGNGIIILTWDEGAIADTQCPLSGGTSCGGHVATLVISQDSCGSDTDSGDQFAILRGIEEAYGVPFLNNSGGPGYNSGDITPAFTDGACAGSLPGTISGQVTSSQGGTPLIGASVTCTCKGGANTATDSSGDYSFTGVTAGTYSLTFSDPGYVTQMINNVTVTPDNTKTENAALVPASTAPTIMQDVGAAAQAKVTTLSVATGATASGDLLTVSTEFDGGSGKASGSVTGVTDNLHDTWTRGGGVDPTTRIGAEVWDLPNAPAGVTSVTVTYSTSVNPIVRFYEISGASALDQVSAGSASASTAPNSGTTAVTSTGTELVIGDIGFATTTATITGLSAGFTDDALLRNPLANFQNSEQAGHESVTATGTFSYSGTLSAKEAWAAVIATFR